MCVNPDHWNMPLIPNKPPEKQPPRKRRNEKDSTCRGSAQTEDNCPMNELFQPVDSMEIDSKGMEAANDIKCLYPLPVGYEEFVAYTSDDDSKSFINEDKVEPWDYASYMNDKNLYYQKKHKNISMKTNTVVHGNAGPTVQLQHTTKNLSNTQEDKEELSDWEDDEWYAR